MRWFEVDKEGLAKVLARRGKSFVVLELLQNAFDQEVTTVNMTLERAPRSPYATLTVEDDDPRGFEDLSHAFTLFADSAKKRNPEQRGRFNIGEKLVLALCREAEIISTTGGVRFDAHGRHRLRRRLPRGSRFSGCLQINHAELEDCLSTIARIIVPEGVSVTVNGEALRARTPVAEFGATLRTEISTPEGYLKRLPRPTRVRVYQPEAGETATLYELGMPVVETGDRFHVDVQQKLPLSMERDNVTPVYLQLVRTLVLNHTHHLLDKDDATAPWVRDALGHPQAGTEAIERAVRLRFGDRVVTSDPSDPEANKRAVSAGYTVIQAGHLSGGEWTNLRRTQAAPPAGRVTPSVKAFSDDPSAPPLRTLPRDEWSEPERERVDLIKALATALLGAPIRVELADDPKWRCRAAYGSRELILNRRRLGKRWFQGAPGEEALALLLHEFGHEYCGDHLDARYYRALCRLGARLARLSATQPALLEGVASAPPAG